MKANRSNWVTPLCVMEAVLGVLRTYLTTFHGRLTLGSGGANQTSHVALSKRTGVPEVAGLPTGLTGPLLIVPCLFSQTINSVRSGSAPSGICGWLLNQRS